MSIGRRENNDIVIANLTVSGNHAKIDYNGDGFILTDLKSKNQTFINDEPVTSIQMNDGDVITIGKHTLLFQLEDGDLIPLDHENGMDQTMAMNTEAHRGLIKQAMMNVKDEQRIGVLGFVEGGDGKIELNRKLTKIGKDPSNDIIVHGFMVGKTAALLSQTPQGYSISHYGGLSKVKVNNQVIKNSVLLEEFDVIQIGSAELQFFYK
ncbi:MAG: FHA domain-containing protein [Proteobacteria bacterium]|nr:FHA domain-containing protein [Pseudomonadota bacterium]